MADERPASPEIPLALRLAALLFVLIFHWPATNARFTGDDFDFYEVNAGIRDLRRVAAFFSEPFPSGDPERGLYRPLTNTSYAVDWALFGDDPTGPHRTNLLLYALVCVAAWALFRRLLASPRVALAAAVLFGVHPVHCEVVDSISGRSELLALGLCAAVLFVFSTAVSGRGARKPAALVLALVVFVAATFAKESAVVLPGVLALHAAVYGPAPTPAARLRAAALTSAPFFVWVPIYFVLRKHALGQLTPSFTVLGGADPATWIATVGAVAAEYTRLMVFPAQLEVDHYYVSVRPRVLHGLTAGSVAGWLVVTAAAFGFCVATWRAAVRGEHTLRPVAVGLGLAAAFLFPVSHVVPFGALMAERFLFTPSFGLILAAAGAWERAASGRPALGGPLVRVGFAVVVLAFGARSTLRAQQWTDIATLWMPLVDVITDDARPANNVAQGLIERGDLDGARVYLDRALALDPDLAKALQNRAYVRAAQGDLAGAEADYLRAVARTPDNPIVLTGLGKVYNQQLRHREAEAMYQRALALDPNYATAADNLRATRAAINKAQAWIDAHPESRAPDAPAADRATLRRACTVVGDAACLDAVPAP